MWLTVFVSLMGCGICGAFIHPTLGRTTSLWHPNIVRHVTLASKRELQVKLEDESILMSDSGDLNQEIEDDADDQDFVAYLLDEFNSLSTNGMISFDAFVEWEEIQDILADEFLALQDISKIWNDNIGSVTEPCDFVSFLKINESIDMAV